MTSEVFKPAHKKAFYRENVVAGFKKTSCFPLAEDLLLMLILFHRWLLSNYLFHLIHMKIGKKCIYQMLEVVYPIFAKELRIHREKLDPEHTNIPIPFVVQEPSTYRLLR